MHSNPEIDTYRVLAHWDADAKVWWAESDDVPGLVAEAATHDALVADLRVIVPEMIELNMGGRRGRAFRLSVIADQAEIVSAA